MKTLRSIISKTALSVLFASALWYSGQPLPEPSPPPTQAEIEAQERALAFAFKPLIFIVTTLAEPFSSTSRNNITTNNTTPL